MLEVRVREMDFPDICEVAAIDQMGFGGLSFNEDVFANESGTILVAIAEFRVVGFLIYRNKRLKHVITRLAVHPQYFRQGVGTTLISNMLEEHWEPKKKIVVIDVSEKNTPTHFLLKKLCFKAESVENQTYHFVKRERERYVRTKAIAGTS